MKQVDGNLFDEDELELLWGILPKDSPDKVSSPQQQLSSGGGSSSSHRPQVQTSPARSDLNTLSGCSLKSLEEQTSTFLSKPKNKEYIDEIMTSYSKHRTREHESNPYRCFQSMKVLNPDLLRALISSFVIRKVAHNIHISNSDNKKGFSWSSKAWWNRIKTLYPACTRQDLAKPFCGLTENKYWKPYFERCETSHIGEEAIRNSLYRALSKTIVRPICENLNTEIINILDRIAVALSLTMKASYTKINSRKSRKRQKKADVRLKTKRHHSVALPQGNQRDRDRARCKELIKETLTFFQQSQYTKPPEDLVTNAQTFLEELRENSLNEQRAKSEELAKETVEFLENQPDPSPEMARLLKNYSRYVQEIEKIRSEARSSGQTVGSSSSSSTNSNDPGLFGPAALANERLNMPDDTHHSDDPGLSSLAALANDRLNMPHDTHNNEFQI